MIRAQDYEQLIVRLNKIERENAALRAGQGASSGYQKIRPGKIATANGDGSYNVRILAGLDRADTDWILTSVLPMSASATYSVGDSVGVVINGAGPHYILVGSGGSGSGTLRLHGHQGYWDGGWSGFLSGGK